MKAEGDKKRLVARRDFLRNSAAAMAVAAAYGLAPSHGLAQRAVAIRWFELQTDAGRTERQARRRAAGLPSSRGNRISTCTSPAPSPISDRRAACSTT